MKAHQVADGWGDDPATTEIKRIAAEFGRIARKYPHASFTVGHSGHYYHEHCTEFEIDLDGVEESESSITQEEWATECAALKEAAKDFMRWIYRQLEKEYEYQNSDGQVDESLLAHEYLFTEDGRRSCVL